MKKTILAVMAFLAVAVVCMGQERAEIKFTQLPVNAQTFIKTYLNPADIAMIKMDTEKKVNDYKVFFNDGSKVKFDGEGDWTKIKLRTKAVADQVVDPTVLLYIHTQYPDLPIMVLERDGKGYEVELSNGVELEFNKMGQLTKVD